MLMLPDQRMVSVLYLMLSSGVMEKLSNLGPFFSMVLDVVENK